MKFNKPYLNGKYKRPELFNLRLLKIISGLILCLGALLGGCVYIRRRRIKALSTLDENSDSTMIMTPLHQQGNYSLRNSFFKSAYFRPRCLLFSLAFFLFFAIS